MTKTSFTFILIICFSIFDLQGQQISSRLDSIYNSSIPAEEKNLLYHQQLKKLEQEKNYTQLGHDAHQVAKWLFYQKGKQQEGTYISGYMTIRT